MSAQPDLKCAGAGNGEGEPSESALLSRDASEMDQTALLMCVVSLGKVGGGCRRKGESVEIQALISSAYLQ